MSEPSMHDLAARLARGDEDAFAELYDACADRLHAYLVGRLGCVETANDVLQTAFLRVVKSRRRFRGVENPFAYVFQVARNEAIRMTAKDIRRKRRTVEQVESYAAENTRHEDADMIAAALAKLDDDDRELVELKTFAGLSFREIAEVTAQPPGTVATRYRRALDSLRGWLTAQLR